MSNAEKIQQWRDEHPDERLTKATLQTILDTELPYADLRGANLHNADLYCANLRGANLRGADLWRTDLRGANLSGADMRGADMRGADLDDADSYNARLYDPDLRRANPRGTDLTGANLRDARLTNANLRHANLHDANLYGADLRNNRAGILTIDGAHPYRAELVPTPKGWILTIGCWKGTIDELRALIAQDEGWPEATGEDIEERRPILEAIADLCDAHIARHARLIDDLAKRWNS